MFARNPSLARRLTKIILVVLSFVLLFFEFDTNALRTVGSEWFWSHQRETESLIIARMVLSRQDGIFSRGGLAGLGSLDSSPPSWTFIPSRDQAKAYILGLRFDRYSPYKSQVGAQGLLFSALDRLIPAPPRAKLRLFHGLNALLAALVLALIILWFFEEFGLGPALFVFATTVASQWLVVIARNLWWSLWAFFLPMLMVMLYMKRRPSPAARRAWALGGLLALCFLVKFLLNGYEFLPAILLMTVVPLAYYAVRERWAIGQILRYGLAASLAAILAFAFSLSILLTQISSLREDGPKGMDYILWTMQKRTHGNPSDFPAVYTPSLKAGTLGVVLTYLKGPFFSSHDYRPAESSAPAPSRFQIPYAALLILFLAASVLILINRKKAAARPHARTGPALLAAVWFSLLAPLSWLVFFKAHSYIHTHLDFIVWHMPFTLFGFALCGLAVRSLFSGRARAG